MNRTANIIAGLLFPLLSFAHGPTPQQANETIIINAPIEIVWSAVKQFDDISSWHSDIKNSAGDGKNESGGTRIITLQNDEQFTEELDYYSEQEHKYKFRIKTENVKALPISSHSSSLQVTAGDEPNTSVVSIKSRFYRGDTSNSPSEQLNDESAVKAMTAFFKNGLNSLQKKLGK
jgi:mxaD protein